MSDLRQLRTNHLILEGFQKLLTQKMFAQITVNDIADTALIHRNTFYHHFSDKYELLRYFISKALDQLLSMQQVQEFSQKPFTAIHHLYANNFEKMYEIQIKDKDFKEIIWHEFLRAMIQKNNNQHSFEAIGSFSAILDWNDIYNHPYDLFQDYQKLDEIFQNKQFPKDPN